MRIDEFDYELPGELIAQQPLPDRAAARMLVLQRDSGHVEDTFFRDLPSRFLGNELVVVNNARVIPARLFARRSRSCSRARSTRTCGRRLSVQAERSEPESGSFSKGLI
jgi:S-adenosylmethionine:tRNA ribosyltransferase-isomerase